MGVAGKLVHVGPDFGDNVLDGRGVNAWNRIQLFLQLPVYKRDQKFLDPCRKLPDLLIEMVQMAEELLEHESQLRLSQLELVPVRGLRFLTNVVTREFFTSIVRCKWV